MTRATLTRAPLARAALHGQARVFMLAAVAAALFTPAPGSAQGWIEPRPGLIAADWGVEKVRTNVTVRIAGRVAEVEVEEWFRNNGGGLGEGDYVYPLPGSAVFTGYSLYQGEQELRGEMMDAARAREIYEAIVRQKRDPALIELVGKGMVRARVFPIEAGQTRRITLRYTQVLDRAGDALQFRYAAGARHVGSGTVAEPAPLTFSLVVEDGARFRDAFSPTHALRVERARGRMTVRPAAELNGDFAVFLPLAEHAVGLAFAAHRQDSGDGYFMLTLSPGDVAESHVPRDVTVVVDVSGSMSGVKMEQAQRALHQLLGSLGSEDRIRLIAFSSFVRTWREPWTNATPGEMREARRWVDQLRADGGTNIHDALDTAFSETSPAARLSIVIFMTDGQATNGETRPDRIVEMAESRRGSARVFAFGLGNDVNTYLLDQLSAATRGTTQYVRPDEDVEQAVSVLAARVRHPVLTDLALDARGIDVRDIHPRDLPDLFAGEELVLFGRYRGTGTGTITVAGQRGGNTERFSTQANFAPHADANDYIPRLWASRKLGDLDRRIRSAQADGAGREQLESMIEELRATALRYGLLSEYTSYLVQEPERMVRSDGRGDPGMAPSAPAMSASGSAAVARAEGARRAREVATMAEMDETQKYMLYQINPRAIGADNVAAQNGAGNVRVIAGRTFALRDGVWTDLRHTESARVVDVAMYSDAYFALIRALPEIGLVLREVEGAVIAGRLVSVRVGEKGVERLDAAAMGRIVAGFR